MSQKSSIQKIPIVDIGPLVKSDSSASALEETVAAIKEACRNVGFFYVKNHGIPQKHFENVFNTIEEFFALPKEEKMKIHIGQSDIFRGYIPIATERTNDKKDWNEAVDFGLDLAPDHPDVLNSELLQGANQWPMVPPGFKALLEDHWNYLINLGDRITEGLALSLDLPRDYFHEITDKAQSAMRILHYPPVPANSGDINPGIGPHIDYGFLTMLAQDEVGGLEVKNTNEEWIPAPYIPGTLVINIGHMIQRWTNDYYKATMHQVKSKGDVHRYSFPFFYEPNLDTVITPLEDYCNESNPSRYEPLHFGNYLRSKYEVSYAESVKEA